MLGAQYYNEAVRKYTIAFATLFNDIVINRRDGSDTRIQSIAIPIGYAPKEKYLARFNHDADLDHKVAITLPRMGFEISGYNYSPNRQLPPTLLNKNAISGIARNVSAQFVPVPYDITFSLHVFSRNTDDATQILEQILPYFHPTFTTTVNMMPVMDLDIDVPVTIQGVSVEDLYEGDFQTRQTLVHSLEFVVQACLFGPVQTKGVITRSTVNLRDSVSNEIVSRVVVSNNSVVTDIDGFGFNDSNPGTSVGTSSSLLTTKQLRLYDYDSSHYVALQANTVVEESVVWTLPAVDGVSGQVIITDGAGKLSWAARSAVSSTDEIPEGSVNLFYTENRANTAIDARVTQSFINTLGVNADTVDNKHYSDIQDEIVALSIALG